MASSTLHMPHDFRVRMHRADADAKGNLRMVVACSLDRILIYTKDPHYGSRPSLARYVWAAGEPFDRKKGMGGP
jgi:hypothetical protein